MRERFKQWRASRATEKRLRRANKALEDDGPFFAQAIQKQVVVMDFNAHAEQFTWLKLVRRACLGFAKQGHAIDFFETTKNAQFGKRHLKYVVLFLTRMGLEGSILDQEEAESYADGVDACDEDLWLGKPRDWSGSEIRTDLKGHFDQARRDRKARLENVYRE